MAAAVNVVAELNGSLVAALAVCLDVAMCDGPICKHGTCDGLGRTAPDAETTSSSGKGVCSGPDVVSQESLMDN
jgi:hypothetical protein